LLEQSLHGAWAAARWSDVDDDELIFFAPGLLGKDTLELADRDGSGPSARIERALGDAYDRGNRLWRPWAAIHIAGRDLSFGAFLDGIGIGCEAACQLSEGRGARSGHHADWGWRRLPADLDSAFAESLAALACLERVHARSVSAKLRLDAQEVVMSGAGMADERAMVDGVVASAMSCINAAYCDARLGHAHETLAAAAWCGLVLGGRPALLPVSLAELLLQLAFRAQGRCSDDLGAAERVLLLYLDRALGLSRLRRLATRVVRRQTTEVVKPGRAAPVVVGHRRQWLRDEALMARVASWLDLASVAAGAGGGGFECDRLR
jgi:hypothetical protein